MKTLIKNLTECAPLEQDVGIQGGWGGSRGWTGVTWKTSGPSAHFAVPLKLHEKVCFLKASAKIKIKTMQNDQAGLIPRI